MLSGAVQHHMLMAAKVLFVFLPAHLGLQISLVQVEMYSVLILTSSQHATELQDNRLATILIPLLAMMPILLLVALQEVLQVKVHQYHSAYIIYLQHPLLLQALFVNQIQTVQSITSVILLRIVVSVIQRLQAALLHLVHQLHQATVHLLQVVLHLVHQLHQAIVHLLQVILLQAALLQEVKASVMLTINLTAQVDLFLLVLLITPV